MDTVFFIIAKLAGALLRPDTWIVALIALAWVGQRNCLIRVRGQVDLDKLAIYRGGGRMTGWLLGFLVVSLIILAIVPVGQLALAKLESQHPRPVSIERLSGVIVLGGGEDVAASRAWGLPSLGQGAERLTAAVELARRFPQAQLIYAGGSGRLRDALGAEATEADVALAFFLAQGISPYRIKLDARSRNTAENAANAAKAADRAGPGDWVIITSAFHMPRALASFRRAGWADLTPYPVDYRTGTFRDGFGWNLTGNLLNLQTAISEWVGLAAYAALGW